MKGMKRWSHKRTVSREVRKEVRKIMRIKIEVKSVQDRCLNQAKPLRA